MTYLLAFGALVMVACALACWLADDRVTVDTDRPAHTCHVRACGRAAYLTVIRRDTRTPEWVCVGCHDEGTAWGWWLCDVDPNRDRTGAAS